MIAPIPLSLLLSWLLKLPRWAAVGLLAPLFLLGLLWLIVPRVVWLLIEVEWLPDPEWFVLVPAVAVYTFTAWLMAPGSLPIRVCLGVALPLMCVAGSIVVSMTSEPFYAAPLYDAPFTTHRPRA
ncbi:hypothetical protein HII36_42280 [Nonomuraea sp. NN258]|uniref:hypothetical protein n=1 Tax=Nonomuraea antri TaxID=2730852 RepID=UPI001568AF6F|nr:hypothetical protein [Nonomuraea antri]NRQ38411.1 hypothetical protein [Nonomuraea antri]